MSEELKQIIDKIQNLEKRITELEAIIKSKKSENVLVIEKEDVIKKLATKIGVSDDKFNEVFDIEPDIITVLKFKGTNVKEKSQSIMLLTLLGYKYFKDRIEILSQEIRKNVAENGIPLDNFSTYINELSPQLVRRKGELKSPKTTYKLTVLGESKAKELLKELIGA